MSRSHTLCARCWEPFSSFLLSLLLLEIATEENAAKNKANVLHKQKGDPDKGTAGGTKGTQRDSNRPCIHVGVVSLDICSQGVLPLRANPGVHEDGVGNDGETSDEASVTEDGGKGGDGPGGEGSPTEDTVERPD